MDLLYKYFSKNNENDTVGVFPTVNVSKKYSGDQSDGYHLLMMWLCCMLR
jgi:hypothetical protein